MEPWALAAAAKEREGARIEVDLRINDRVLNKIFGDAPTTQPPATGPSWAQLYTAGVRLLSVVGIALGVVGLVLRHDTRLNLAIITLAAVAMAFQFTLVAVGGVVALVILVLIISALSGLSA